MNKPRPINQAGKEISMRKLALSEWANVAEIIASIVIVASLVYVALEINQNTQSLQQGAYQNALDRLSTGDLLLAADGETQRIVSLAEADSPELTATEWERFKNYAFPRIGVWEYTYLAHEENAISSIQWTALSPYFENLYCTSPGYQRFFKETEFAWSKTFMGFVQTTVSGNCN
jgi:hypothetical protein